MANGEQLFSKYDWFSLKDNQIAELKKEIASYNGNQLLNTSVHDLSNFFAEKYRIDVPVLDRDRIIADQREEKVDVSHRFDYVHFGAGPHHVPGTSIEISIPFDGDHQMFQVQPTRYCLSPPRAIVRKDALVLTIVGVELNAEQVRSNIDANLKNIDEYLTSQKNDAEPFNASLLNLARVEIEARRTKLLANQNLVSSLGFALKQNPNSPMTYSAPNVRRKFAPSPPPASSSPFRPEPCLPDAEYEHILQVIHNMAHVMERSPAAFAKMDEEALRTHFLVQLNGHYEGQATGETFNSVGKTDILIRANDKNIFIGECKFWGGPKMLTETIDQLLGYSSWRDTKVAVLVFNRNKSLSKVLESVQATTSSHSNCKRVIGPQSETSFRYVFSHLNDANREMTVTVMVFDVP